METHALDGRKARRAGLTVAAVLALCGALAARPGLG